MKCLCTTRWSWIYVNTCNLTINSMLPISMAILALKKQIFVKIQNGKGYCPLSYIFLPLSFSAQIIMRRPNTNFAWWPWIIINYNKLLNIHHFYRFSVKWWITQKLWEILGEVFFNMIPSCRFYFVYLISDIANCNFIHNTTRQKWNTLPPHWGSWKSLIQVKLIIIIWRQDISNYW